ncbi:adenosine deaminase [Micropruina sonneratiae]|uniref:adenosine deaminase n=1 Tax=Micropruina sonneratiae TaxID=2986940 RepID=UPI002227A6D3|nr:adenosine deaminase [Micropruina sp. KQZ13P-5]MCW3156399.1 adenosine deaminase [Micropruina sp. KQZ13P-5]
MTRDLDALPKAHLHLHFTGSMSIASLQHLADLAGIGLHESLVDADGLLVPPDQRGWFRFQRLYDMARKVVCSEEAMRFIIAQAARDDAAEGSRRLELQVDPSSYAPHVGGLQPAIEIILDEARAASSATGVQVAIVLAASRVRHPLDARTIARLAARYAGPEGVVAFGLSNNERAGATAEWAPAFTIARNAGLPGVPHGGELLGPTHLRQVVEFLRPTRIGHGIRSAEDRRLLDELVRSGIALEVCPTSNVHLGVYAEAADVPLRHLVDAGATVALSADDPLLFLSRLTAQYRLAREQLGFSDPELAELARSSIRASLASDADKARWLAEVDDWLEPGASDAA